MVVGAGDVVDAPYGRWECPLGRNGACWLVLLLACVPHVTSTAIVECCVDRGNFLWINVEIFVFFFICSLSPYGLPVCRYTVQYSNYSVVWHFGPCSYSLSIFRCCCVCVFGRWLFTGRLVDVGRYHFSLSKIIFRRNIQHTTPFLSVSLTLTPRSLAGCFRWYFTRERSNIYWVPLLDESQKCMWIA